MIKFNFPDDATPLDDYSGLIPRWVATMKDLNMVEAENIYEAQKRYLSKRVGLPKHWFNVTELKKIHKAMFGRVWEWAGQFRKSVTSIGVAPYLIQPKLSELCADVVAWEDFSYEDMGFIDRAARIHHRLVFIHPFENGNGRFSRLIADRYLLAHKCIYPNWPYDLHDTSSQRAIYIKALKAADSGDYEPLIKFMRFLGACE